MRLDRGPFTAELEQLTGAVAKNVLSTAEWLDESIARRDRADRSFFKLIGMMVIPRYAETLRQDINGDQAALVGVQNRLAILEKVAYLNIAVRNDNGWAASMLVGREGEEAFEHDFLDLTYYPDPVVGVRGTPGVVVELNSEWLEPEVGERLSEAYSWIVGDVLDIRRRNIEARWESVYAEQGEAQENDRGFRRVVDPGY